MEPLPSSTSSPFITSGHHSRKFIVDSSKPSVERVGDSTKISQKVKFNDKEYFVKVTVKGELDEAGVQSALEDALAKTKTLAKAFNIGSDESHITSFTLWGNGDLAIQKDAQLLTGEEAKQEALSRFKTEKQHYKGKTREEGDKQAKRETKIKNLKQIKDLIAKAPKHVGPPDDKTGITLEPVVEKATAPKVPAQKTPAAAAKTPAKTKKESKLPKDPALKELAKEKGPDFFAKVNPIKVRAEDELAKLAGKKVLSRDERVKLGVIENKLLYLEGLETKKDVEWFEEFDLSALRNVIDNLLKDELHIDIEGIEQHVKDMCEQIKAGENKAAQRQKIEKLKAFIPTIKVEGIKVEGPKITANVLKRLTAVVNSYFDTKQNRSIT